MGAFLQGLLLGFSAAVPLGPINIMIMTAALRSYFGAFAIGLGAMSADVFYLLLLSFGILEYLQNETVLKAVGIFGICYLVFIAWLIFKGASAEFSPEKNIKTEPSRVKFVKNYTKGLFATLSNPYTIGFWLSVATFTNSFNEHSWLVVLGLIVAITLWITIMPFVIFKSSKFISPKFMKWANYLCAVILIGFALALLKKILF
ncbi:LysE family translocator [Campylobacter sp.]|uniref:LysE family translocator n=1 Tax=Campylobacter sp. TaxID=205 RepID=UPI0026F8AD3B|nr:LysE family translocator [Campylobacter sp.]